ncbi:hypothetical protein O3Q51_00280 [Cryomorphaceae bacterium 1068]|nr:hypothetical protein [Cryomorphaceae bacterium 1068]
MKNKFGLKRILPLAFILVLLAACDHDTEPETPSLFDRFAPLELIDSLQASSVQVDFSAGESISFTAEFNKNIDWVVEITGQVSGGIQRIEGFDRFVEPANATWSGNTTELPLFRTEPCTVVLKVPEEPDFGDTLMVEIVGTLNYEGTLVTDFEDNPGACIQLGDFEFELANSGRRDDIITAAQGDFFYRLAGTDNETGGPTDNFFVGLARIFACITGETYIQVPTTVPENLYLNLFVEGRATPYTRVVLGLIIDSNDSGDFEEGPDAIRSLEFDPTYTGWRLQSFTGADFGVTQEELQKVVGIELVLISLNNLQPSPREEVGFETDYIIFTQNGPLEL